MSLPALGEMAPLSILYWESEATEVLNLPVSTRGMNETAQNLLIVKKNRPAEELDRVRLPLRPFGKLPAHIRIPSRQFPAQLRDTRLLCPPAPVQRPRFAILGIRSQAQEVCQDDAQPDKADTELDQGFL
jgi:hypothetical protein